MGKFFTSASKPCIGLQAFKQIILPALHLFGWFKVSNAELSNAPELISMGHVTVLHANHNNHFLLQVTMPEISGVLRRRPFRMQKAGGYSSTRPGLSMPSSSRQPF
jgi:hypothetical protein